MKRLDKTLVDLSKQRKKLREKKTKGDLDTAAPPAPSPTSSAGHSSSQGPTAEDLAGALGEAIGRAESASGAGGTGEGPGVVLEIAGEAKLS